jgi:Cu(I)/Ag(I) efflux system membrane protein CusA/SilA
VTALLGAPNVKAIRGFSDFGFSYVYVIFRDGTDIYWARSRTVEYLSKITARLPQGVQLEIGPDATALGWVYQYALVDRTNNSLRPAGFRLVSAHGRACRGSPGRDRQAFKQYRVA